MKEEFLLNPDIAYLNHGSFGACPRPVFEAYQRYQLELEREPVDFLQRHFCEKMHFARTKLADFLGCGGDDLAFVRNTTYGMNVVARSVSLQKGDVILTTDQEYGAVDRMWELVAQEAGARVVRVPVPLPVSSPEEIIDAFRVHLSPPVKVMAVPHLAAETGIRFPVEKLISLARAAGVVSAIDGAHAPGQLPLNLSALGADFYVGNCHKWLLSPKGAGFVYAAPGQAEHVRSPIIGWGNISQGTSKLLLENEWQGTSDTSAFMAVGDAVDFLKSHNWFKKIVPECSHRLASATSELLKVTKQNAVTENESLQCPQMASFRLPPGDHSGLHATLFEDHQIEVPVFSNEHGDFIRVSVQAYNSNEDLKRLTGALRSIL